jgi:hypothetical protein
MTDEQFYPGPDGKPRETVYKPKRRPNGPADDNIFPIDFADPETRKHWRFEAHGFVRDRFKDGAAFLLEYVPISYSIGGILPAGSLYFLTGLKGHGKTVLLLAAMFAVALNRPELLGVDEVEPGHVAYVAFENPIDIRMKMAAAAFAFNIPLEQLVGRVTIIDERMKPNELFEQLRIAAERRGPLQAVFYDTFQAGFGFNGGDFNDNAMMLNFTVELRKLTQLPGGPSTLVAAHPCKNAGEASLEPYGGGALLNEADGNLTLWKDEKGVRLHWNKVRGPNFEPRYFRIEMLCTPDIVDNKGRQVLLPVCRPSSEEAVEERQADKGETDARILASFADEPKASVRDRQALLGVTRSTLHRRTQELAKKGFLAKGADGAFRLTKKGREEIPHLNLKKPAEKGRDDDA